MSLKYEPSLEPLHISARQLLEKPAGRAPDLVAKMEAKQVPHPYALAVSQSTLETTLGQMAPPKNGRAQECHLIRVAF